MKAFNSFRVDSMSGLKIFNDFSKKGRYSHMDFKLRFINQLVNEILIEAFGFKGPMQQFQIWHTESVGGIFGL